MTNQELKSLSNAVLSAIREVSGLPPFKECKDCDLEVGYLCPMCGLLLYAGDLARYCLYNVEIIKEK